MKKHIKFWACFFVFTGFASPVVAGRFSKVIEEIIEMIENQEMIEIQNSIKSMQKETMRKEGCLSEQEIEETQKEIMEKEDFSPEQLSEKLISLPKNFGQSIELFWDAYQLGLGNICNEWKQVQHNVWHYVYAMCYNNPQTFDNVKNIIFFQKNADRPSITFDDESGNLNVSFCLSEEILSNPIAIKFEDCYKKNQFKTVQCTIRDLFETQLAVMNFEKGNKQQEEGLLNLFLNYERCDQEVKVAPPKWEKMNTKEFIYEEKKISQSITENMEIADCLMDIINERKDYFYTKGAKRAALMLSPTQVECRHIPVIIDNSLSNVLSDDFNGKIASAAKQQHFTGFASPVVAGRFSKVIEEIKQKNFSSEQLSEKLISLTENFGQSIEVLWDIHKSGQEIEGDLFDSFACKCLKNPQFDNVKEVVFRLKNSGDQDSKSPSITFDDSLSTVCVDLYFDKQMLSLPVEVSTPQKNKFIKVTVQEVLQARLATMGEKGNTFREVFEEQLGIHLMANLMASDLKGLGAEELREQGITNIFDYLTNTDVLKQMTDDRLKNQQHSEKEDQIHNLFLQNPVIMILDKNATKYCTENIQDVVENFLAINLVNDALTTRCEKHIPAYFPKHIKEEFAKRNLTIKELKNSFELFEESYESKSVIMKESVATNAVDESVCRKISVRVDDAIKGISDVMKEDVMKKAKNPTQSKVDPDEECKE